MTGGAIAGILKIISTGKVQFRDNQSKIDFTFVHVAIECLVKESSFHWMQYLMMKMIMFEPKPASWCLCVCLEHNSKDLGQPRLSLDWWFWAFVQMFVCG